MNIEHVVSLSLALKGNALTGYYLLFHGKQMFIVLCRAHCSRGHLLWLRAYSDCITSFTENAELM